MACLLLVYYGLYKVKIQNKVEVDLRRKRDDRGKKLMVTKIEMGREATKGTTLTLLEEGE